jgi:hypothetical protein
VRRVGSQHEDGADADVPADGQQPPPQLFVDFGAGGDGNPGPGAADDLGEVLAAECGVDRGGDADRLGGQGGGVQRRGVDAVQGHRVGPAHPERGQCVGDLGDLAGELRVGPGEAPGVVGRVRDPLGRHTIRPGRSGVQQ